MTNHLRRPSARETGRATATPSLYRVAWRWHFYAGVLITPVVLVVAITGALYVFRGEVEDAAASHLRFVEPGPSRLGPAALVALAAGAEPNLRPEALELSADPCRAAIVRFDGPGRDRAAAYLDPYRGRVLGSIGPGDAGRVGPFFDAVLALHRRLFLGTPGRIVVELAVGWTILLMATGLYLWWPRRASMARGVWWPKLRGKRYVVLRDLHAVVGFYAMPVLLVIAGTGLFYTVVWSEGFHQVTRARGRPPAPTAKPPAEMIAFGSPSISIDEVVARARGRYPDRILFVTLPKGAERRVAVSAGNDFNNTYGPFVSARFQVDRVDGSIGSLTTLADDPRFWWHGWAYPLHVGSVLGPWSKVAWLGACLVLAALPVTGLWMWWDRRPRGRTGFPRRVEVALPPAWAATIAALAVLLPVAGASIALILAGEWSVRAIRRARGRSRAEVSTIRS